MEKKEFKTTCKGCENVTYRPYVDFDKLIEEESKVSTKVKTGVFNTSLIAGTSMACLPLGCCMMADSTNGMVMRGKPKEERIQHYCQSFMCKKCHSMALTTEIVTHNV